MAIKKQMIQFVEVWKRLVWKGKSSKRRPWLRTFQNHSYGGERCITVITRVGEKSEDWKAIFLCPAAHDPRGVFRGNISQYIQPRYGTDGDGERAYRGQAFLYICDLVCLILNCCIEWAERVHSLPKIDRLPFIYVYFKMGWILLVMFLFNLKT